MPPKSVFDPQSFENPDNLYRPLQIVHGLDRFLDKADTMDVDPAGQWAEVLQAGPGDEKESAALDQELDRYLQKLADLGNGGIVTNVGFEDYLVSRRQWEILRRGLRRATELGLRAWIYDEKGYPSGTAGGIVTRANPEFAALGLACYTWRVEGPTQIALPLPPSCRKFVWAGATRQVETASRTTVIDLSQGLDEWQNLHWDAPEGEWHIFYMAERVMYEGTHAAGNVSEWKQYINLLDPEATRAFLRVTHEAYRREIPADLWPHIEAFFTDEPSFITHYVPPLPERYWDKVPVFDKPFFTDRPPALPWVHDFLAQFQTRKGYDLRSVLFALFFSQNTEARSVRQDYYEVLTALIRRGFYEPIQRWCRQNNVLASGHVLLEENILDHAPFEGSLFAALRHFDLPGIDMLNANPQEMIGGGSFMGLSIMAAKQAASVAHLTGCSRVHSESSDWEQHNRGAFASLKERLGQANLLHVMGVNQITSYFGWAELDEEAWRQYNQYVGRISSLLSGGRHVCDTAVLYPIRSLWSDYLPPLQPEKSWGERDYRSPRVEQIAQAYPMVVKELLTHQIDLDIIDEEAVLNGAVRDGRLHVSEEAYRLIVLPPLSAISLEVVYTLQAFTQSGGQVVAVIGSEAPVGTTPIQNAALQEAWQALFAPGGGGTTIALSDLPRLALNAPDLQLAQENPDILYTHRLLEGHHVYFIINNAPQPVVIHPSLREKGPYQLYHPLTGKISAADAPLRLELEGYEGIFIKTAHPQAQIVVESEQ